MKNKSKNWFANGNAFISLPVILITLLVFVPMISALFTSFQSGPPTTMSFNGLGNYQRMLSDSTFILIDPSTDHAVFGFDRLEHTK